MLKTFLNKALSLFFILGFLFIPLTFYALDKQSRLTRFIFLKPVTFIQGYFFEHALKNIDFSSDTISLNILLGLLFALACIVVLLINLFNIRRINVVSLFKSICPYYIALIFLKYGFDKIFKQQFYLPEPNILYTSFGNLTSDILYWSTIGTSYSYSVVTGVIEVLTAMLILIKPARILGYCLSIGVLINIVLINFSFDISVKTFSLFLFAAVLFAVYPYLKVIYAFFVQHKQVQLPSTHTNRTKTGLNNLLGIGLIGYVLFPYILAGNFNDDKAPRPLLHGAYAIEHFTIGKDTLNRCDFPYKRVFIHRNNYIIFQRNDDVMVDYFFELNPQKNQLELQDYQENKIIVTYNFIEKTGILQLKFNNAEKWIIESRALNWKALPVLQNNLHYSIDEIK